MTTEPGGVGTARATALSCKDTRQWFAAVLTGNTGLTEWMLVEAHLRHCGDCRQERARLQQARLRTGSTAVAAWVVLRARLRGQVAQVLGPGIGLVHDLTTRLGALLMTDCVASTAMAHQSLRAARDVTVACRHCITRVSQLVRRRASPAVPLKTVLRALTVILGFALAAYPLQGTSRSQQPAWPTTSPTAGVERTPAEPFLPPVVAAVDADSAPPRGPRIEDLPRSRLRPAPLSPQRAFVREVAGDPPALSASVPAHPAWSVDIVGRLSAKSRTTAERDVVALLAEVGGTEVGRQREAKLTTIEVVMPWSAHDDFLRGLVRIGTWQLEAARSPLRDTVHATVRVTE